MIHMIEEYARHNGHADLLRERIDGTVGAGAPVHQSRRSGTRQDAAGSRTARAISSPRAQLHKTNE
jgi:hypothetical protein